MIQRRPFPKKQKETKAPAPAAPQTTQADKLADEVMQIVGKDKVIRSVLRDQLTGLHRQHLTGNALHVLGEWPAPWIRSPHSHMNPMRLLPFPGIVHPIARNRRQACAA